MAWVDVPGVDHAARAVVPVWAVEALVADALDVFVTAVTDGVVALVAARCKLSADFGGYGGTLDDRHEAVLGVVAMLIPCNADLAEIKVGTGSAVKELVIR